MSQARVMPDVLTLDEAADYLRISRESVERLAPLGQIPGRLIDDEWRFSRVALDDWLRGDRQEFLSGQGRVVVHAREDRGSSQPSRERMIEQAGRLAHDPTLGPMLDEIYRKRGRPESDSETE